MQLHEQTQRFILLLIFYLFGPILTLGIIGGIVVRKHSSNARSWERALTLQTGLHWKIHSVEYRSPGFTRLHKVEILDEAAQRTLFYAQNIDIRLVSDTSRSKVFPGVLESSEPEKTGLTEWLIKIFPSLDTTDHFWQISAPASVLNFGEYSSEESALLVKNMLRKILARFAPLSDVPVQFHFEEVAVISEHSLKKPGVNNQDKIDIFRSVQGNIYRTPSAIRSDWAFQIQGISDLDWQHRERLSFALSLDNTLEISFQTGGQPIPCGLAAVFCSPFKHFTGGSFRGEFFLSTRGGSSSPTIRLNNVFFKNVPLAPLVGPYTDFAVMGTIFDLRFPGSATFGPEGNFAEGCLQVENGALEKALFHRCVDRFQLTVQPETALDLQIHMIPITACAIHFRLHQEGIDFWADQKWRDAIMYYQENSNAPYTFVVALPAQRRTVTYHELMSIFASDTTPVVPLTPGFQALLPLLPIR